MMGHMAVHRPDTGIVGNKFNIPGLPGGYENGILADLGIGRDGKTVRTCYPELMAVQMDGMMVHLDIAETYPYQIAAVHLQRERLWIGFSIDGKEIEHRLHKSQRIGTRGEIPPGKFINGPFLQDTQIILIRPGTLRTGVFHNQPAEEAGIVLNRDFHMGVI